MSRWASLADKIAQQTQQLVNHHVHPLDRATGERRLLPGCIAKDRPNECKSAYPRTGEAELFSDSNAILCPGLCKTLGVKSTGKRSKLGSLSWHYTIDQSVAVQHLPTNITGRHADFNGPGNKYSIGLEMCEHKGNSLSRTIDRTAKLAAYLMYKHGIPLSKVVPHYHWPRYGMNPPHKNCPHFLLDNGRPGKKWRGFQARVKYYSDLITVPGPSYAIR